MGNDSSSSSAVQTHLRSYSFGALHASFTSSAADHLMGPPIRPLDLGTIVETHETTHLELARTVEDLAQWLSVVELGLSQILDNAIENTIEEEQEQEDVPGLSNDASDLDAPSLPVQSEQKSALVAEL